MRRTLAYCLAACVLFLVLRELPAHAQAPDELPEGADFGPPPRSVGPRSVPFDASEPLLPNVLQFHVGVGVALDASSDEVLVAHGFGESPFVFSGDIGFLGRLFEWLYLGARIGGRGRGWASNDRSPAIAGGLDAMMLAHVRAHIGRVIDLGLALGVGIGWGGVSMTNESTTGFAPRAHGSALVGFRLAPGIRFTARIGWDWFSLYDLDRYGSDVDLGGPSLSLGVEVRR